MGELTVLPTQGKRGPKFGRTEREQKVAEAIRLESQGFTQEQIAEVIGVHRVSVAKYLGKARERFRDQVLVDLEDQRRREVELTYYLQQEAIHAWERSKMASEKTISEKIESQKAVDPRTGGSPGGARFKVQTTKVDSPGDPRFLQVAAAQSEARRKLLGLDAPSKQMIQSMVAIDSRSELVVRMEKYAELFGLTSEEAAGIAALGYGSDESVDSDGPDAETSAIPDAH